jgi:hypothetical protein
MASRSVPIAVPITVFATLVRMRVDELRAVLADDDQVPHRAQVRAERAYGLAVLGDVERHVGVAARLDRPFGVEPRTVKPSMVLGLSASTDSGTAAFGVPVAVTFTGTTCCDEPLGVKSK